MIDGEHLERTICSLKPRTIIHLAGISSSQYAFHNPYETLQVNGLITAKICEIIHKNKINTKLFNASSSEIFKGHVQYSAIDLDKNMYHCHPYSIAKIMGHSIIDFYRNTYNLPFSNGILFTTESIKKRPEFLLNKVKNHANEWLIDGNPIELGDLNSYRNIIHASDVASAIRIIIDQDAGNNYLLCNYDSSQIISLVKRIYENAGIILVKIDNNLCEESSRKVVIHLRETPSGLDDKPIDVRGYPTNLLQLGWSPKWSIDRILTEK
jgi:GDPmannose 4,6-dehydratase